MNGPWDVHSDCTPDCAAHALPRVPATRIARRGAAFARTVRRALTDGERMAEPGRLRTHARALLDALDIPVEGAAALTGGGGTGTLVVVNHISWLDILALLAVEPVTLLAKREVGGWPVVGGLARRAGTHFIDRTHPRRLPHTVREVSELLAAGRSVAVFPQATTWCTAEAGSFRRATFQAAIDAGAPVRPVTLDYRQQGLPSTVAAFCGEDTFAGSLRRVLAARALTVRVTAHPVLWPLDGGLDRRELAALAARAALGGRPVTAVTGAAAARPAAFLRPAAPVPHAPPRDTPAHV
ncbi:1-acyl-sn-glycerol-3-phosphate acyltransferase [Streptomyces platensis]|uniref:lysophospholipid acyltransferase family protein n=1 Tax=Streptomyces platensis TaxID=58346 RepID=UPI002E25B05C|nr:1-acyl-sn-glycerol-3-phosphate acyltransferase [Streptomyces platensis]WUB82620.1 1-acyl-sn-glycerol-3-phosphate acyltransferase [Streptomyces platensis]